MVTKTTPKKKTEIVFTSPVLTCHNPENNESVAWLSDTRMYACMLGIHQLGLPQLGRFQIRISTLRSKGARRFYLCKSQLFTLAWRVRWGTNPDYVYGAMWAQLQNDLLASDLPIAEVPRMFFVSIIPA